MTVEEGVAQEAVAWLYEIPGSGVRQVYIQRRTFNTGWTETALAPQAPLLARIADLEADVALWKREAADRSQGMVDLNLDRAAMGVENMQLREALEPFVTGAAHTMVFLRSREKMHPAGQDLYIEDVERAKDALATHTQEVEKP